MEQCRPGVPWKRVVWRSEQSDVCWEEDHEVREVREKWLAHSPFMWLEVFVCITIILVVEWDLAFLLLVVAQSSESRIGVNSHEDVSNDEYV